MLGVLLIEGLAEPVEEEASCERTQSECVEGSRGRHNATAHPSKHLLRKEGMPPAWGIFAFCYGLGRAMLSYP